MFFILLGLDGTKWYTKSEFESAVSDEEFANDPTFFLSQTGTYVLDGNTLIMMPDPSEDDDPDDPSEPVVLTKQ